MTNGRTRTPHRMGKCQTTAASNRYCFNCSPANRCGLASGSRDIATGTRGVPNAAPPSSTRRGVSVNPTRATTLVTEPTSELDENKVNGGGDGPAALPRSCAVLSPMA